MGPDKDKQKQTEADCCRIDVKRYFKSGFKLHDSSKYYVKQRVYTAHFHTH